MNNFSEEKVFKAVKKILSEKRFTHSLGVANEAKKLAKLWGAEVKKAELAGLAHDLAKEIKKEELEEYLRQKKYGFLLKNYDCPLLHGPAAAVILKEEFKIFDEEIFDAVFYHTTGKADMPLLTKIIYVADFSEEGRSFPEAKAAREISYKNLDAAAIYVSGRVIINTVEKEKAVHPDTVFARNFLLSEKQAKNKDK